MYALAIPILISGIWSADWLAAVITSIRVYSLYITISHRARFVRNDKNNYVPFILGAACLPFGAATLELISFDFLDARPTMFSHNSSVLAQTFLPFVFWNPIAAVAIGMTGARLPALFLLGSLVGRFSWQIVFAALVVLLLIYAQGAKGDQRLTVERLIEAIDIRVNDNLNAGKLSQNQFNYEAIPSRFQEPPGVPYNAFYGYGYHSYNSNTEAQTPHNLFVLVWKELGLLALFPFAVFIYGIRKIGWWFAIPVIGYSMGNDDVWHNQQGFYNAALMFVILTNVRQHPSFFAYTHRRLRTGGRAMVKLARR